MNDACTVAAVIGEKPCVGLKLYQPVKKERASLYPYLL